MTDLLTAPEDLHRIVWLASYPKSGNTWTRVLLTNYLRGADVPAAINGLDGGPIASARVWFDEPVGIEASQLPAHVVARLRPEVYRMQAQESPYLQFLKVHDAWTRVDTGEGMFPADVTRAVVYLMRNPLDVAGSYAAHMATTVDKAVTRMCDPDHRMSPSDRKLGHQLTQTMGTWSDHVRSWVDESGLPVHVVRYEDLRSDTVGTFAGMLAAIGFDVDLARVEQAVEFSAFDRLQKQEQDVGFRERPTRAERFFRKGQVGGWHEELDPELVQRLCSTHESVMRRFGYLAEDPAQSQET